MPQHKSAEKRVRQTEHRRARNRVQRSRMRTMIKKLRETHDKGQAQGLLNDVKACLDRLSAKGLLPRNTAANYKSALEQHVNNLA
jgi:small subunit ribosomal protein S20